LRRNFFTFQDLEKKLVISREENAEERRSQEAKSVRFEDMENMVSHFDGRLQEKNLQIKVSDTNRINFSDL
jgi:hypothetical protein